MNGQISAAYAPALNDEAEAFLRESCESVFSEESEWPGVYVDASGKYYVVREWFRHKKNRVEEISDKEAFLWIVDHFNDPHTTDLDYELFQDLMLRMVKLLPK